MNLKDLLKSKFVDSIARSTTEIGIEIELPAVPIGGGAVPGALAKDFAAFAETIGFRPVKLDNDGFVCEFEDEGGSTLSFETSWNTLELSLKYEHDLLPLYRKYVNILIPVQNFYMSRGYYLCGRGVNPNYAQMDPVPLNSDILQAKSRYLSEYTPHKDGEIFHALCASVQTHLDAVDFESYLKLFNMLRRAYVFDALFFANSVPVDASFLDRRPALKYLKRDTMCYRDELWKYCGAPNTVLDETPIKNEEDFLAYLDRMKLFIAVENGKFRPMPPTALKDYCNDPDWIPEMLTCFRSLEPVSPTMRGTMEIRSTCVQPLDAMFEPAAFYTGLAADPESSAELVDGIYSRYFPGKTAVRVRDDLMLASNRALRDQLRDSGRELLELSLAGLKSRGLGEERLLEPLIKRFESIDFVPPAQCTWDDAFEQTKAQMINLGKGIC